MPAGQVVLVSKATVEGNTSMRKAGGGSLLRERFFFFESRIFFLDCANWFNPKISKQLFPMSTYNHSPF
jgi:hypothetical protein